MNPNIIRTAVQQPDVALLQSDPQTGRAEKVRRQLHELDYFTTQEAADYLRVSLSQFKERAPALGLRPFRPLGRVVYRKVDLHSFMEVAWQAATSGARSIT